MTRVIRPPAYGDASGRDLPRGADRPTRNPVDPRATLHDLDDTLIVAILAHGLPTVEQRLGRLRRRLDRDPETAFADPRPRRKPRRPWNEPPYPAPEEETCR